MMVLFGGFVLVNKGNFDQGFTHQSRSVLGPGGAVRGSLILIKNRPNNNINSSIPCAAPSTPSKSLVGYKRARNSREKEVEDRTYPHLDHVDNPRQTTHAVGVLKAVKIGRHFSG